MYLVVTKITYNVPRIRTEGFGCEEFPKEIQK